MPIYMAFAMALLILPILELFDPSAIYYQLCTTAKKAFLFLSSLFYTKL